MKIMNKILAIIFFITLYGSESFCQDGLIIPMPKVNTNQKDKIDNSNTNHKQDIPHKEIKNPTIAPTVRDSNISESGKSSILPMPSIKKNNQNNNSSKKEHNDLINNNSNNSQRLSNSDKQLLISLPKENKSVSNQNNKNINKDKSDNDFDDLSSLDDDDNEFSDSQLNKSELDNLLPSNNKVETRVAKSLSGDIVTVYPKDTDSAIFMVMKSWQCEGYNIKNLITQALDVYGKEAGDEFQINGLENIDANATIDVEEEDITFDELLSIIASKAGNDWGCDIPNKTIYYYSKGIKVDSYLPLE